MTTATEILVDLVSDTATRPTPAMRQAMCHAPVGDEQRGEDPTVNALTRQVAALLGKEAAILLPSGTMCNQIALAVHCQMGDEIICAANSHILSSEGAGAAVFAHSTVRGIGSPSGLFDQDELAEAIRPSNTKAPRSRLVCVEQTCNRGGGTVWPLATLRAIAETAQANGLRLHMDGARLLNACVASGVPASRYAEPCDSVWLDLSKGLGCPVGAVLAGSRHFIEEANRWKHRMGGAMRQAGILAAAGLYALEHHVDRLAHDHANARKFAAAIAGLPGIRLLFDDTPTNLVFFDISASGLNTRELSQTLMKKGVRIGVESPHVMRAVFHLDIDEQGTDLAIDTLRLALPAEAGGIRQ